MNLPWWWPFGRVPEIAPRALAEELAVQPPQLVDVRTPAEFAAGHIAGAINVPIYELATRLPSMALDPTRPVVAVCLTGHRSVPAVRLLAGRGFQVRQLAGGMTAWWRARLPDVKG